MARGDETRARILDGARELIHTRSYNAVGVLQICSHAGVKKGSFYYFFPSKQALAFEMLDAMREAETRDVLAPAYDSGLPPLERIAQHARLRGDASAREQDAFGAVRGCPFGGLATEMNGDDTAVRDCAAGYIDRIQTRIGEALAEAAGSADLRQMCTAGAAEGLSAQFQGAGVLAVARNDPSIYLRLSESINALVRAYA